MRGFCGKCGGTFESQMLCPQCGIQLCDEGEASTISFSPAPLEDNTEGPSVLRRIAVGAVASLVAFHGLQHLATALFLSHYGNAFARPEVPVACLALAALAGAYVAGTANRRAEATGLLLALIAGAAYLWADHVRGIDVPAEWLTGMPILFGLIGIVGGLAGRMSIPPTPKLPRFGQSGSRVVAPVREPRPGIAWIRVAGGASLTIAATALADPIRHWLSVILTGHGGTFAATQIVAWQISVMAAVAGGVVSGSNTRRGIAQGFAAGLIAAIGTAVTIAATDPTRSKVMEFWVNQLELGTFGPQAFAALAGGVLAFTTLGGWLGSQVMGPRVQLP